MNRIIVFFAYSLFLIFFISRVHAYNDTITHPDITNQSTSVQNSELDKYLRANLYFKNGIETELILNNETKTIKKWTEKGSTEEDSPDCRASNHFHDPLKPWDQSYMSDDTSTLGMIIRSFCESEGWSYSDRKSNITWATGFLEPAPDGTRDTFDSSWSPINWDTARAYYYKALTKTAKTDRDSYFALAFKSLGHVLHLIEDMAVPAHVRNDFTSHLTYNGILEAALNLNTKKFFKQPYEYYVEKNPAIVRTASAVIPSFNNTKLTDFWDTEQYNGSSQSFNNTPGLAEFTNANYLSESTIGNNDPDPEHDYPFPSINSSNYYVCEDAVPEYNQYKRWYISRDSKTDCDHFALVSLLTPMIYFSDLQSNITSLRLFLDDNVHNTYAEELLPRAIGYAAGLIDYFFRGKINIIQTGIDRFQIVNLSDETIEGNIDSFRLFYDDSDNNRIELPLIYLDESGNEYINPDTYLIIPPQSVSNFEVRLMDKPQAPEKPGEYMLVFKGRIGNEGGVPYDKNYAVAAQYITPHFLTHINIDGQWDIYEYDLLGNRIYNVTGTLPEGQVYHHGIPNPFDPDLLLFQTDNPCSENPSDWTDCAYVLTRSTGTLEAAEWTRVPWWSNDGQRIYGIDGGYYDMQTQSFSPSSPWNNLDQFCGWGYTVPPSLSPDGSMLAVEGNNPLYSPDMVDSVIFSTDESAAHVSYIIDMNSMTLAQTNDSNICTDYLDDEAFFDTAPDFHPSENRLVFASDAEGPFNVYYTDIDTRAVTRLTSAGSDDFGYIQPAWSPDGSMILMAGEKQGELSEIYIMPASGGEPAKITNEGIDHFYPQWIRYPGQ